MKKSQTTRFYVKMERKVLADRTSAFDLRTLNAVHEYMEFEAKDDVQLDAWLHAQIIKAQKKVRA